MLLCQVILKFINKGHERSQLHQTAIIEEAEVIDVQKYLSADKSMGHASGQNRTAVWMNFAVITDVGKHLQVSSCQ